MRLPDTLLVSAEGGATEGVAPMSRNACATSRPPTVKLPSTTVSICSDRVGAVPEQLAACVTLRGVGTAATAAEPLDSVVLEVLGSNCQPHFSGSLPRHAWTSAKWCVVVLCSRYSCSWEHSSKTGLHVRLALLRQHEGEAAHAVPRRSQTIWQSRALCQLYSWVSARDAVGGAERFG